MSNHLHESVGIAALHEVNEQIVGYEERSGKAHKSWIKQIIEWLKPELVKPAAESELPAPKTSYEAR